VRLPLAVALLLVPPASAHAGTATLTVPKGVKVAAGAPATLKGRTVTFPLVDAAPDAAIVQAQGKLAFKHGRRSATLTAPQLVLGTRVTAVLGGQRTTVFRLEGTRVRLAPTAAKTLERRLRAKLPRALGTLTAAPTYRASTRTCPASTAAGTAPTPGDPPVKPRPAGAIAITSATVTWHPRESFIQYIATGEGTAASNGATADPPTVAPGSEAQLVYGFHFAPTGGWCDPATGSTRATFAGTVGFAYKDHAIDLRVNDPEVELDGPASRVIFRMTGSGGDRRAVVETLDVSRATVAVSGKTVTYDRIPAAVPPGAADSVFAGYYLPGDPFGWVSISFTTA
jgi:hypothetical protein